MVTLLRAFSAGTKADDDRDVAIVAYCKWGVRRSLSAATHLAWILPSMGIRVAGAPRCLSRHTWFRGTCGLQNLRCPDNYHINPLSQTSRGCRDHGSRAHEWTNDEDWPSFTGFKNMWNETIVHMAIPNLQVAQDEAYPCMVLLAQTGRCYSGRARGLTYFVQHPTTGRMLVQQPAPGPPPSGAFQ